MPLEPVRLAPHISIERGNSFRMTTFPMSSCYAFKSYLCMMSRRKVYHNLKQINRRENSYTCHEGMFLQFTPLNMTERDATVKDTESKKCNMTIQKKIDSEAARSVSIPLRWRLLASPKPRSSCTKNTQRTAHNTGHPHIFAGEQRYRSGHVAVDSWENFNFSQQIEAFGVCG